MNILNTHPQKLVTAFFLSSFLCLIICVPYAESARQRKREHIPTDKIIEFSLMEVKKVLREKVQKNEKLSYENATLHKDINYLKRMLEGLAVQKSQLSGQPLSFYYPQERQRSDSAKDLKLREQRTQVLIGHFEREISRLEEKIRLIKNKLDSGDLDAQRNVLIDARKNGRNNLANLQKKLKKLEQTSKEPLSRIQLLNEENLVLQQEVDHLESSIYTIR